MSIRLETRIYLEDTDAGGIVYHASYLRFMERARTELLRCSGLEQSRTFGEDFSLVVHKMQLRFAKPARLDDEVAITCGVGWVKGASFGVEQRVLGMHDGMLHCEALVTIASVRLSDQKPRRLPGPLVEYLCARTAPAQV